MRRFSSLVDICRVSTGRSDDLFVGVRVNGSNPEVVFPFGFHMSTNEDELRRDIIDFLRVLRKYPVSDSIASDFIDHGSFRIDSYVFLITQYLINPSYMSVTVDNVSSAGDGPIDWRATFRHAGSATVQNGTLIFPSPLKRRSSVDSNRLLSLIHQYSVYIAISRIGWLFTGFVPNKPQMDFDIGLFRQVCTEALAQEFNDNKTRILRSILGILRSEDDLRLDLFNFEIGTNRFEYVWEAAVESIFGNVDRSDYFPGATWSLESTIEDDPEPTEVRASRALEPDSVMVFENDVFVIDSKFYKYSVSHRSSDLPGSSDLSKQISYSRYASMKAPVLLEEFSGRVFNVFVLPFDSSSSLDSGSLSSVFIAGRGWPDWITPSSPEDVVVLVLLDTRDLLLNTVKPTGSLRKLLGDSVVDYFNVRPISA